MTRLEIEIGICATFFFGCIIAIFVGEGAPYWTYFLLGGLSMWAIAWWRWHRQQDHESLASLSSTAPTNTNEDDECDD